MMIDDSIPGWTSQEKLTLFAQVASWANQSTHSPTILEIGSWAGRSLVVWGANCPGGIVYSVDSSRGYTLSELQSRDPSVFPSMRGDPTKWDMWDTKIEHTRAQVVAAHGLQNVKLINKTSDEFFEDNVEMFDIIFVDGSHEEDFVYRDICNARLMLKPDGLLCGDDYLWPGVRAAVDRYVAEHKFRLYIHPKIHDLWIIVESDEVDWWLQE